MSDPNLTAGLVALAGAIQARMDHLGLTVTDVWRRTGLSRGAIRVLLDAKREPRRSTLEKMDEVLGWPAGVASAILNEETEIPAPDQWADLLQEKRLGEVRAGLLKMRKEHYRLSEHHQEMVSEIDGLLEILDAHKHDT